MTEEIALVADFHGNLPAVQALDEDLKRRGIRRVWCLGDTIGKGPSNADTLDWALAHCEVILQGNWEEGIGKKLYPKDEFYYRQLGEKRMAKLLEFPMEHRLLISGRRMRLIHGRPFMEKAWGVQQDEDLFLPLFGPEDDILGYADVHRQGLRVLHASKMIFNTGSVGNALGITVAEYAILRGDVGRTELSPLDINLVTLPYDREQAIRDAEEAETRGLVNADLFRSEIRTGRYARAHITDRPKPQSER